MTRVPSTQRSIVRRRFRSTVLALHMCALMVAGRHVVGYEADTALADAQASDHSTSTTQTLSASPPPSGSLGLYLAPKSVDPQTAQTPLPSFFHRFDWTESYEGWMFHSLAVCDSPLARVEIGESGALRMKSVSNVNTYGYWESPEFVFVEPSGAAGENEDGIPVPRPDPAQRMVFRLQGRIRSQVDNRVEAPDFRLRVTSLEGRDTVALCVSSVGDAQASPATEPVETILLFDAEPGWKGFRVRFEMLNRSRGNAPSGDLRLDWIEIESLPAPATKALRRKATWTKDANLSITFEKPHLLAPFDAVDLKGGGAAAKAEPTGLWPLWTYTFAGLTPEPARAYRIDFGLDPGSKAAGAAWRFTVADSENRMRVTRSVAAQNGTDSGSMQPEIVLYFPPARLSNSTGLTCKLDYLASLKAKRPEIPPSPGRLTVDSFALPLDR